MNDPVVCTCAEPRPSNGQDVGRLRGECLTCRRPWFPPKAPS